MAFSGFSQDNILLPAEEYYFAESLLQIPGITKRRLNSLVHNFGLSCCPIIYPENPYDATTVYNKDKYIFEIESPIDCQRALLLTGAYGDFAPITAPQTDTHRWIDRIRRLDDRTNLSSIVEEVCLSIGDISPIEALDHETMYRVVHFLTCIRHDVMAADLYLRKVKWNPIVSFENPFYYKKGYMRNWVMSNNILKSELIEFLYNVFYLLISAYKVRNNWSNYSFFVFGYDNESIKRYHLFDYINDNSTMNTICAMVSKMHDCLYNLEIQLKQRPMEYKEETVNKITLLLSLQKLFHKIQCLVEYIRSFRLEEEPPTYAEQTEEMFKRMREQERKTKEENEKWYRDTMASFEKEKRQRAAKKIWNSIKYCLSELWLCFFDRKP